MGVLRRAINSYIGLRILYYPWVAFPYPIRKPLTAMGIWWILQMKRLFGVNRQTKPTPMKDLGNLSFWGVPDIDLEKYTLRVEGAVENPLELTFDELTALDAVDRPVHMDCVGGPRNNWTLKGVSLALLFEAAGKKPEARTAVFHCADDYFTSHSVADLLETDAFMAYETNGERLDKFGFPLRLAAPGTYGYKWPKWVVRIELVTDAPKGYWELKGLPNRGRVGDTW